ncbi:Nucleolin (Protein C23) [Durusdinium trenchii]|uniref:Nucleolin (Protein C23) n=1 Tax=Durusdinium trenchii TaxID=1381693 RepID=A0ABP0PI50_9DINO
MASNLRGRERVRMALSEASGSRGEAILSLVSQRRAPAPQHVEVVARNLGWGQRAWGDGTGYAYVDYEDERTADLFADAKCDAKKDPFRGAEGSERRDGPLLFSPGTVRVLKEVVSRPAKPEENDESAESASLERTRQSLRGSRGVPDSVWFSLSDSTGSIALKLPHQMEGTWHSVVLCRVKTGGHGIGDIPARLDHLPLARRKSKKEELRQLPAQRQLRRCEITSLSLWTACRTTGPSSGSPSSSQSVALCGRSARPPGRTRGACVGGARVGPESGRVVGLVEDPGGGYAHVAFEGAAGKEKALKLDKAKVGKKGRYLKIEPAKKPNEGKAAAGDIEGKRRLFVKNLPYDAAEDDIAKLFSKCGKVLEIRIPHTSGRSKGFAYVEFAKAQGLRTAMELDPAPSLQGRKLLLDADVGSGPKAGFHHRPDAFQSNFGPKKKGQGKGGRGGRGGRGRGKPSLF